jgi:Ca-activated chloride channel family protein
MAGEVVLRSMLARPVLPVSNSPQVAYLLLEILPGSVVAQVRVPVSVCFVLDRSGSMKGEKIDRVRRAVTQAIDLLSDQDLVSVVIFDHRSDVLIPTTSVRSKHEIYEKVMRIRDAGGTKIGPALEKGLREIGRTPANTIRRLLLLTDGQTEGEQECLARATEAGRLGIPITALGVGKDWNEDLLIEMANRSSGTADYIERPDRIVDYFQNTVQRAQATAIQNATLTLRLVQGLTPRAVWQAMPLISNLGYRPISDRDVSVPLGELETGAGRALLIELMVDPRPAGQYRIGQVEVSYDIPVLGMQGEKSRAEVMMTFTTDQSQTTQVVPQVMNIVEKISAFKLQTRALDDIQQGNVSGATQKLQSAVTRLLNQGEVELAQTMQQEINNLQTSGQISSEGQKTMKFGTRKTVKLSDLDLPPEMRQNP